MAKPDSISAVPHLDGIIEAFKSQLAMIDRGLPIMALIDIVPEPALYWLASQYNVLGNKGWNLVSTEAERRTLIKTAIELHRFKGTPFAVKDALRRVGYLNTEIEEAATHNANIPTHNSVYLHNFAITHGGGLSGGTWHWTEFAVILIHGGTSPNLDSTQFALLSSLIGEYKPQRSTLRYIQAKVS